MFTFLGRAITLGMWKPLMESEKIPTLLDYQPVHISPRYELFPSKKEYARAVANHFKIASTSVLGGKNQGGTLRFLKNKKQLYKYVLEESDPSMVLFIRRDAKPVDESDKFRMDNPWGLYSRSDSGERKLSAFVATILSREKIPVPKSVKKFLIGVEKSSVSCEDCDSNDVIFMGIDDDMDALYSCNNCGAHTCVENEDGTRTLSREHILKCLDAIFEWEDEAGVELTNRKSFIS